jgi:O-acetyl-ADP-ribose deacetylase (regulator of RNase III)
LAVLLELTSPAFNHTLGLLPQGVSGAIKRRAGYEPFRELSRKGVLPLGGAVITGAGRLPFRGIIHVAGIGLLWRSSEESVRKSVRNALALATQRGFRSVAFPLIGAGTGGGRPERVQAIMLEEIKKSEFTGDVLLVRFKKHSELGAPPKGGPAEPLGNSGASGGPPSVS